MSEDLIVRHCAPTLAGLKTGNMFTATFASKAQLDSEVHQLNQILADKGLRVTVLRIACYANQSKSQSNIKNRSKASGYWKVYGDVDRAQKQFERFSKCTGVYLECLGRGLPITKLVVNTKVTA